MLVRRRAVLPGLLAVGISDRGRAKDLSTGLSKIEVVKAVFMVMDPKRFLGEAAYRVETFTALDEPLYASSEYDFEYNLVPEGIERLIVIPAMRIRSDGTVQLHIQAGDVVFEASCKLGPVVDGAVYFRIDPVVRRTRHKRTDQEDREHIPTPVWDDHLWSVNVSPRPGFVSGSI